MVYCNLFCGIILTNHDIPQNISMKQYTQMQNYNIFHLFEKKTKFKRYLNIKLNKLSVFQGLCTGKYNPFTKKIKCDYSLDPKISFQSLLTGDEI